jgi:hypothetical protein
MDEPDFRLLKTWEKHTRMSMKGEKRGFSGSMAHWMVCKVLKRKEYYVSFRRLQAIGFIMAG